MKRPSSDALLIALLVLNRERDELAGLLLRHPGDQENAQRKAALLEEAHAWLEHERQRAAALEAQRCTAGRAHRVRDVENQGDRITVERCRCGASRVRDARAVGDEVTDWRR